MTPFLPQHGSKCAPTVCVLCNLAQLYLNGLPEKAKSRCMVALLYHHAIELYDYTTPLIVLSYPLKKKDTTTKMYTKKYYFFHPVLPGDLIKVFAKKTTKIMYATPFQAFYATYT